MNEGHIFIDGEIDAYMFQSVKEQIEANRNASKLIVHMSSPGGSVYHGYNIYHKIKSLPITKEGIIEGSCMSIATFIMLACDKTFALNPSRYMIHLPSMGLEGTRSQLETGAKELELIEQEMISAYKEKTKLSDEKIRSMMTEETYMTAEEAKSFGFVDDIKVPLKAVAFGKRETKMKKIDKTIFDDLGNRIASAFKDLFAEGPKAQEMPLQDGRIIQISEDGMMAMIDGQPAPAGDYTTADGKVIKVGEGGMIVQTPVPTETAPQKTPEQLKIEALESELATIKASMASVETAKSQAEQAKAEAEAKVERTAQAFKGLQTEFEELKKKTIGDDAPPAGAQAHKKEPAGANPKVEAPEWQVKILKEIKERTGLGYHVANKQ
jgi:ATP-dependent Clp endopeptidase proteolytic subunit ClpP